MKESKDDKARNSSSSFNSDLERTEKLKEFERRIREYTFRNTTSRVLILHRSDLQSSYARDIRAFIHRARITAIERIHSRSRTLREIERSSSSSSSVRRSSTSSSIRRTSSSNRLEHEELMILSVTTLAKSSELFSIRQSISQSTEQSYQ